MRATLMLCDSAQAVGGKLYILGGGWSITGPMPAPSAVALYLQIPWDAANDQHEFTLELLDSDGGPITDPEGNPVQVTGQVEVGRPPGLKRGTPIDFPMAINVPPLELEPNSRFEWKLKINGQQQEDWSVAFSTRPPLPPGAMPPFGP